MAAEADRVVVELIAQTDQFNAAIKSSSTTFTRNMGDIERSSGSAAKASGALRIALNDNRVAMDGMAHGSSLATRELLVLTREAARGDFTRMAGSATILTTALNRSGQSIGGLVGNLLNMFGVIKKTTDADLAAAAANAAANAENIASVAKRAAANVAAADAEIALAEAALRTATTSTEEAAAQARLALAHEAVAATAAEATIAEDALAVAEGRAGEATAAAAAKSAIGLGRLGTAAVAIAPAAILTYGAFKALQEQVKDSGTLDKYAESLGLTTKEMKKLRQEVGGLSSKEMQDLEERAKAFELTWGDVFHGLGKAAEDALDISPTWARFKAASADAFGSALKFAITFAADSYGVVVGGVRAMGDIWHTIPPAIGDAFYSGVNVAIGAIDKLLQAGTDGVNKFIGAVNSITHTQLLSPIAAPQIAPIANSYAGAGKTAGAAFSTSFAKESAKATADARAQIQKNLGTIYADIIGEAEKRIKGKADALLADRTPKKPKKQSDHGLQEALDELDAQIEGQKRLAAAYAISDAAVIKAEALQKAEEQAIRHKGEVGMFYERELALAIAKGEAENAKKISSIEHETAARTAVNDAVAAGLIPASQANDALKLETELRPLLAEYQAADADGKKVLGAQIRALTADQAALNAQIARESALRQITSNSDEIAKLKLEKDLIGASNRERAVALSQLEAQQYIKNNNVTDAKAQADLLQSYADKANAAYITPFQQWAQSVPRTSEAINESLQSITVRGFDTLADSITGVITGTQTLGQAFKSISQQIIGDIIQMTLKMTIFRSLSNLFGPKILGPDLGASLPVGINLSNTALPVPVPHFATGGSFPVNGSAGDTNVLSINGVRRAMVGGNETIAVIPSGVTPSNATAAMPSLGLGAGLRIQVVKGDLFDVIVDDRASNVAAPMVARGSTSAAMGGASIARRNLARESMHRLD